MIGASDVGVQAFFLEGARGRSFCLLHEPDGDAAPRAALLYLHPFAEEMNRSRRMAALQSRALARAGYAVLQLDLHGCGDSDGEFGDATWAQWQDDANVALDWLKARSAAPVWIWGLRAGCLLAAGVLRCRQDVAGLLLWQPQLSGKLALRQFMRIKLAENMLAGAGSAGADDLRGRLARGESVEIAGYLLAPGLAIGIEASELTLPSAPMRIECLEITSGAGDALPPALSTCLAQWIAAGHAVRSHMIRGAPFWQMAEPEEVPHLLDATVLALTETAN